MSKEQVACPTCGHVTQKHKHGISNVLVRGLRFVANETGAFRPGQLFKDLPRGERSIADNFQKLRYWELVRQVPIEGKTQTGVWVITPKGRLFLEGRITVPHFVYTINGRRVGYEGEWVDINTAATFTKIKQRPEYAADAVPVGPCL